MCLRLASSAHQQPVITRIQSPGALPAVLRGSSPAARHQREQVAEAAARTEPVLIVAEPGLDAAHVARILHDGRPSHAFQALDCAASPTDILGERLFGRGEPAGRHRRDLGVVSRRSALVSVGRGTLFLANVTEMGAAIQGRLARVLRDGEVYVDDRPQPVTVRGRIVVSASPDILDDVRTGRFRPGLYRRFAACRIDMVPLRERAGDIPDIVQALSEEAAARRAVAPRSFTPAALIALASLSWPRNLDEMRELMERLYLGQSVGPVRQEDVLHALGFGQARPAAAAARFESLRLARLRFEREYIAAVLDRHGWRMAEAAVTLGIERANLYRKIRQLGLPRPTHSAAGEQ